MLNKYIVDYAPLTCLRVNKCEFSVYTVRIFMRDPNNLLTLYQIINKPWFSFLADEIAEPRPDRDIKVAAFTVGEKSINT